MKQIKLFLAFLLIVTMVAFVTGTATASEVRHGIFQIEFVPGQTEPRSDPALNDGFQQTWFYYPPPSNGTSLASVQPLPWWNEWWYNDPFIQPGGKWVDINFQWQPIDPGQPTDFHVTINWTNGGWRNQGTPPIGGQGYDPELYIERLTPWVVHSDPGLPGGSFDTGIYWLPIDYNPVWVSVDVRGNNVLISNGTIDHQCVPIPGAVLLFGSGLAGLAAFRRRFKK